MNGLLNGRETPPLFNDEKVWSKLGPFHSITDVSFEDIAAAALPSGHETSPLSEGNHRTPSGFDPFACEATEVGPGKTASSAALFNHQTPPSSDGEKRSGSGPTSLHLQEPAGEHLDELASEAKTRGHKSPPADGDGKQAQCPVPLRTL